MVNGTGEKKNAPGARGGRFPLALAQENRVRVLGTSPRDVRKETRFGNSASRRSVSGPRKEGRDSASRASYKNVESRGPVHPNDASRG